jgi:hypothetical protein
MGFWTLFCAVFSGVGAWVIILIAFALWVDRRQFYKEQPRKKK